MRNRLVQKQQVSIKLKYVAAGAAFTIAAVLWILSTIGVFTSSNSSAQVENIDFGNEYWLVETVNTNASMNSVEIDIHSKYSCRLQLKILNQEKELLKKESVLVEEGKENHIVNDISFLPAGKYLVEISGEDKTVSRWVNKH